jgi:hypothetical protein
MKALQSVLATFDPLDLELLTGPDVILIANLGGQDDLTFAGYGGGHEK